jgi:hypothetical protein
MNYIYRLIILLAASQSTFCAMRAIFFKPSYWQEKPRFDRRNMTTVEATYTYAKAEKSFNSARQKVPLLSYRGSEPLLPSFLNPKIAPDQNRPLAYAAFDGKYKSQSVFGTVIQNIHERFFFEATSSLSYDSLNNLKITPTLKNGTPILYPNQKLEAYLQQLNPKLFSSGQNSQNRTYIGPSYFMFGYTKSFNNFEYVDMIDISIQTGCVVPIIVTHHPDADISLFPREDILNLGIPLQVNIMCGLYDWLNIGATASVIGYLQNDLVVPLNQYPYHNKVLVPTCGLATIKTEPLVALTAFIEGEYLIPHWNWFVGFSYTKQHKTVFCSLDQERFPNHLINKYTVQYPWQQLAVTLSSEIDFSSEEKKIMPRCKIVYVKRFASKNCFNTSLFAGQLGFEVLYDF